MLYLLIFFLHKATQQPAGCFKCVNYITPFPQTHTLNTFQDVFISPVTKPTKFFTIQPLTSSCTQSPSLIHQALSLYRNTSVPRTCQLFLGSRILQVLFPLSRIFLPQIFTQVRFFSLCILLPTTLANVDFLACSILATLGLMIHLNFFHGLYHSLNLP